MRVKPLEWVQDKDGDWSVRSIVGTFEVWYILGWRLYHRGIEIKTATMSGPDAAKAEAQRIYETIIHSTLENP